MQSCTLPEQDLHQPVPGIIDAVVLEPVISFTELIDDPVAGMDLAFQSREVLCSGHLFESVPDHLLEVLCKIVGAVCLMEGLLDSFKSLCLCKSRADRTVGDQFIQSGSHTAYLPYGECHSCSYAAYRYTAH